MGSIVTTALKLGSCRNVPIEGEPSTHWVHYYGGSHECYGFTWYVAIFLLIIMLFGFGFVYHKLRSMPKRKRSRDIHPLISMTDPYIETRWYWEFILTARRISLSALSMLAFLDIPVVEFIMIVVITLNLWLQAWYSPFRNIFNDVLELICLICLLAVTSAIFSDDLVDDNGTFITILVTIVIFVPIFLVMLYACYAFKGKKWSVPGMSGMSLEEAIKTLRNAATPYAMRQALQDAINEAIRRGTIHQGDVNNLLLDGEEPVAGAIKSLKTSQKSKGAEHANRLSLLLDGTDKPTQQGGDTSGSPVVMMDDNDDDDDEEEDALVNGVLDTMEISPAVPSAEGNETETKNNDNFSSAVKQVNSEYNNDANANSIEIEMATPQAMTRMKSKSKTLNRLESVSTIGGDSGQSGPEHDHEMDNINTKKNSTAIQNALNQMWDDESDDDDADMIAAKTYTARVASEDANVMNRKHNEKNSNEALTAQKRPQLKNDETLDVDDFDNLVNDIMTSHFDVIAQDDEE